jgi:XRE family transcriptional regulator, regulator of sulfur utilization
MANDLTLIPNFLIGIEGRVQVQVAGSRYDLDSGDVLAFPGVQRHSYLNVGGARAQCLSVVALAPHGV